MQFRKLNTFKTLPNELIKSNISGRIQNFQLFAEVWIVCVCQWNSSASHFGMASNFTIEFIEMIRLMSTNWNCIAFVVNLSFSLVIKNWCNIFQISWKFVQKIPFVYRNVISLISVQSGNSRANQKNFPNNSWSLNWIRYINFRAKQPYCCVATF